MIKLDWTWVWDNRLALSLVANMLLIVVLLSGQYVELTWEGDAPTLKPADGSLKAQVARLFRDEGNRAELRALLEGRRFYEISADHQKAEHVTDALGALQQGHELLRRLRQLSHLEEPPFQPKELKVTLVPEEGVAIAAGEAAVCRGETSELRDNYLAVWSLDDRGGFRGGFTARATKTMDCRGRNDIIVIGRADWPKLKLADDSEKQGVVTVHLHWPSESVPVQVGAESAVVVGVDRPIDTATAGPLKPVQGDRL